MPSRHALWDDVPDARRAVMRAVKGKDTKPELAVRRMVHAAGYRYRLHRKDLPGRPDLAFGPRKKVIFVHGWFWHSHSDGVCKAARLPVIRVDYWAAKLEANRARDARNVAALKALGWQVLVIWECWLKDRDGTLMVVRDFLGRRDGAKGT